MTASGLVAAGEIQPAAARFALVAGTSDDARKVCIEGISGLLGDTAKPWFPGARRLVVPAADAASRGAAVA